MENSPIAPTDELASRASQKVITKIPRSLVPKSKSAGLTTADRVVRWLMPWGFYDYPGIRRGMMELTALSYESIKAMRRGQRRMTGRTARIFADLVERRCEAGLAILAELRAIEKADEDKQRVATGWQVVRERNGVMRDGRGSFKIRD